MKRNKTSKTNLLLILPWIGILFIVGGVIYVKHNEKEMQKAKNKTLSANATQISDIVKPTTTTEDFLVDALKTLLQLGSPYTSLPTTSSSITTSLNTALPTLSSRAISTPTSSSGPPTTLIVTLPEYLLTALTKLTRLIIHNVDFSNEVAPIAAEPWSGSTVLGLIDSSLRPHQPSLTTIKLIPLRPTPPSPPTATRGASDQRPPDEPPTTAVQTDSDKLDAKKKKVIRVMKKMFIPMFGLVIGLFILHACAKPCFNSNLRLRGESSVQVQLYPRVV